LIHRPTLSGICIEIAPSVKRRFPALLFQSILASEGESKPDVSEGNLTQGTEKHVEIRAARLR